METLLPSAAAEKADRLPGWYARATRLSAYAASFFVFAPLAIAPVFLYAWVGEMGYVTRWAFTALAAGCAASLVAVPAGTLVQALDRPGIQARAAIVSIALNIPLSLTLVRSWGVDGAALGTALAMILSSFLLVRDAHRAGGLVLSATWRDLVRRQWPLWLTCGGFAFATQTMFSRWLLTKAITLRYLVPLRLGALAMAVCLYIACVVLMILGKVLITGLDNDEKAHLARWQGAFRGWWDCPIGQAS
jgi:Na+-driven multidrug efflux pump